MIFEWDFTDDFFKPIGKFGAFFILLLGITWILYAIYETSRRGSFKRTKVDDWDFDLTKFLKALTYVGFLVGILCILSGISGLVLDVAPSVAYESESETGRNLFTCGLLIIVGILTFVKPANDLPLASLIGILAASLVVVLLVLIIPESAVDTIAKLIDPKWLLVVVFIVIFAIVALIAKFYTAAFMTLSKILSWPPLALILAVFCIVQGVLLLVVGVSISGYF